MAAWVPPLVQLTKVIVMVVLLLVGFCPGQGMNPKCRFDMFSRHSNTSRVLLFKDTNEAPQPPRIVWSKIDKPVPILPKYAKFGVAEMDYARISFMAGIVFDENGCVPAHLMNNPDLRRRTRFMESLIMKKLSKQDKLEIDKEIKQKKKGEQTFFLDEIVYFGGSLYSRDFQHAVIDFLPMYNLALPLLLKRPKAVAIAGPYAKFFADRFPFNLTLFAYKDEPYKKYWHHPIAPIFYVRKLIYVDFAEREQSYTLPGAYDGTLPFLKSTSSPSVSEKQVWMKSMINMDRMQSDTLGSGHTKDPVLLPFTASSSLDTGVKRNLVVFLDRSKLNSDAAYVKSAGKSLGRSVVDQVSLIARVKDSLRPEYELVVWTCKNFLIDRTVMERAVVIMGPHGGHFVNMIFAPSATDVIEFGMSYTLRQLRTSSLGVRNSRWVFVGMASALGHRHWFVEDSAVVAAYLHNETKPTWTDNNITVDFKQVIDTLVAIGVSKK
jgi:hypothetical protein